MLSRYLDVPDTPIVLHEILLCRGKDLTLIGKHRVHAQSLS